jgi:CO/xanthine dehydrogenase FAD-binding subunit
MANLSIVSWLNENGSKTFHIVVGAGTPLPLRLIDLENALSVEKIPRGEIANLAHNTSEALPTLSDARADSAYRQRIFGVLLERHLPEHLV